MDMIFIIYITVMKKMFNGTIVVSLNYSVLCIPMSDGGHRQKRIFEQVQYVRPLQSNK